MDKLGLNAVNSKYTKVGHRSLWCILRRVQARGNWTDPQSLACLRAREPETKSANPVHEAKCKHRLKVHPYSEMLWYRLTAIWKMWTKHLLFIERNAACACACACGCHWPWANQGNPKEYPPSLPPLLSKNKMSWELLLPRVPLLSGSMNAVPN